MGERARAAAGDGAARARRCVPDTRVRGSCNLPSEHGSRSTWTAEGDGSGRRGRRPRRAAVPGPCKRRGRADRLAGGRTGRGPGRECAGSRICEPTLGAGRICGFRARGPRRAQLGVDPRSRRHGPPHAGAEHLRGDPPRARAGRARWCAPAVDRAQAAPAGGRSGGRARRSPDSGSAQQPPRPCRKRPPAPASVRA